MNTQSICFGWFTKNPVQIKITHLSLVNGGVNSIDFDHKLNLLATANQNSVVNLFNPYINEPNGVLSGHSREVLVVKFMPSRSQLISVCADKIFRVWNVPLQVCIQRIGNIFTKGPESDADTSFNFINYFRSSL